MSFRKIVIIGGSDAGISAGLRVKELIRDTEVTMILADQYPNFSICGLPFYLSDEVSDWKTLAHCPVGEIENEGIRVVTQHHVRSIVPDQKTYHRRGFGGSYPDFFLRQACDKHGRQIACS
jgi:NADPH-dependent 2,4-dienoyl-CoA reductase/sulfur reductase-like enzyme